MAALATLGLACSAGGALLPYGPPRIAAGLLLALVLPGYALAALALRRPAGAAEVALCTLGGSIVTSILTALVLYALPVPMNRAAWAVALGAVVLAAAGAAVLLPRPPLPGAGVAVADPRAPAPGAGPAVPAAQPGADLGLPGRVASGRLPASVNALLGALAMALAVIAVLVARDAANRDQPFAEIGAVPIALRTGAAVRVEVRSHERGASSFRLVATGAGGAAKTTTLMLALAPGQVWRGFLLARRPSPEGVRLSLYVNGASTRPLRTVTYLPVAAGRR